MVQQDEKRLAARRESAGGLAIAISNERNKADECFSSCPTGATPMHHRGVAVLEKGWAACGIRLALRHLGDYERINTKLTEHLDHPRVHP